MLVCGQEGREMCVANQSPGRFQRGPHAHKQWVISVQFKRCQHRSEGHFLPEFAGSRHRCGKLGNKPPWDLCDWEDADSKISTAEDPFASRQTNDAWSDGIGSEGDGGVS